MPLAFLEPAVNAMPATVIASVVRACQSTQKVRVQRAHIAGTARPPKRWQTHRSCPINASRRGDTGLLAQRGFVHDSTVGWRNAEGPIRTASCLPACWRESHFASRDIKPRMERRISSPFFTKVVQEPAAAVLHIAALRKYIAGLGGVLESVSASYC